MLKIKIKRFDKSLPLPEYQTKGAAAMDLCARLDMVIAPQAIAYVPLNIAIELPSTHWALIAARSSLHKRGLMLANGIGIGDSDYCGDNDEYRAALYNFSQKEAKIDRGERVVQLLILPREQIAWQELAELGRPDRGGFGTTGDK